MKWLLLAFLLAVPTPRSSTARERFLREMGYPKGRPGYVVDHIIPLASGGCDCSPNLQFQTVEEARLKDAWERCVPPWVLIKVYGRGKMAPEP